MSPFFLASSPNSATGPLLTADHHHETEQFELHPVQCETSNVETLESHIQGITINACVITECNLTLQDVHFKCN